MIWPFGGKKEKKKTVLRRFRFEQRVIVRYIGEAFDTKYIAVMIRPESKDWQYMDDYVESPVTKGDHYVQFWTLTNERVLIPYSSAMYIVTEPVERTITTFEVE